MKRLHGRKATATEFIEYRPRKGLAIVAQRVGDNWTVFYVESGPKGACRVIKAGLTQSDADIFAEGYATSLEAC